MDGGVSYQMHSCRRVYSRLSTARSHFSYSFVTSSCHVENRCFQIRRFGLGQPKLMLDELQRTGTLCSRRCSGNENLGSSVRCGVNRDVPDKSFAYSTKSDKQSLPTIRICPRREKTSTKECAPVSFDNYEDQFYEYHKAYVPEPAYEFEDLRVDSSHPGLRNEDEVKQSQASCSDQSPSPLDSGIGALEEIVVKQWWMTFIESIDPHRQGIIILNVLTFFYGSNIAVIKETTLDAASFSVGRFVIAAVVFAPFLKDAVKEPGLTEAGLELGVWAGIGFLAQALGLMTTDAGRASFFTTFTVLTVPFIAGLMGKKIPLLTWLAAVAALFGVGLLETTGAPPSIGDAWSLLSAVVFGIHIIRTEFHSRNHSTSAALPLISLQLFVITGSSCMWFIASHLTSGSALPNLATLDWPALYHTAQELPWGPMVYSGLFSTAICLSAEIFAMRTVSATEAAVITTMEPLWGAGFAWYVLGERWGLRGWVGAAFILGGSLATQIWGSDSRRH
ncbi:uncharacterized protein [Physcomitrium patens]|uniref:EamA domain-containing protein n=1 Tax=Physcomitrium patens TaxID=3218 RepID=A0A2K1KKE4_PHYPA|nr:uncharacterized protein LOC112282514 [Physcomitrium patens]XP_024375947.1 uncharacterized protein LOC112282514 [Physcomitrium patens]PNR54233.1 hypothetical protein PHYPA_007910 [Physcomitrium patens]|eukprot:XP_024375946.1 uncharacterized protein LOC112282514 [Physcomitrella patens]